MTRGREAEALERTVGVCVLSDILPVRIGGDDARDWLNGQVTNDLRAARPGGAVYALQVDLRGRVVTDLWVLDEGEALVVLLPAPLAPRCLEILDGYIVMEDVEIEPLEGLAVLSAQGPRAGELRCMGEGSFPVSRLGTGGRERLVPAREVEAALREATDAAVALGGVAVSPEGWELARLRLARPRVELDCAGGAYPQEAGLQSIAVSFEKGCYVGQEPVVMLEHRGKPPRRLVQMAVAGDAPPSPGAPITTVDGQSLGEVSSSAPEDGEGALALGYVRRAQATIGAELRVDGRIAHLRRVVGD